MTLNENITKAIKESLPTLAANELSEFIEQAQRDKKLLDEHKEVVRKLSLSTVEMAETIKGLDNTLKAYKDLEKREREVEKREQAIEVTLAKADLVNAVKAKEDVFKLAEIAFRNPRLVHNENSSVPIANNLGYYTTANANTHKVIEETK